MTIGCRGIWASSCIVTWIALRLFFGVEAFDLLYSVAEESKLGAVVGHLSKDLNMDLQKIIYRELRVVSESGVNYLDLKPTSGALVITQALDRERICGASLTCHIRAQIILQKPLEVHHVTAEVVDVNDNAPFFQTKSTSLEISEAASVGATYSLEGAIDVDVGDNSLQSYLLSPNECFILKVETKSDGSKLPILVLNKPLDREKQSVFQLILTALDGGKPRKSATTLLFVNILDINDNAPKFDEPVKRVRLVENSPFGTLVTTLNASDADHGLNGELTFMFDKFTSSHVLKLFMINPVTGELRVTGEVDHEHAYMYDITFQARDKGSPAMEGSCNIKVEITDVNDNAPVITINSLTHELSEGVSSGTVIALLSIKDDDIGENGKVNVWMTPGLPFKISSPFESHYTIMTDGLLDRETVAEYTITVKATDSGSPSHSSKESFVLCLSDVNDNVPVFSQLSYSVDVAENNAPNALVLSVSAFDPDMGENSTLTYSIEDWDNHGVLISSYVYINPEKGQIYTMRSLDYEEINMLQIVVQVCDQGSPRRSTNVTVYVFIQDQNDHFPKLLYPQPSPDGTLQFLLSTSAGAGHLVNRIACVDNDSGHNAWLFYSLAGPDARLFHIGAHTGEIRTATKLDQDKQGVFCLIIIVQDNGTPTLSATVSVNVTLAEKITDVSFALQNSPNRKNNSLENFAFYLISSLSCIIAVCLLTIMIIAVRWLRRRGHLTCIMHRLGFKRVSHQGKRKHLHLQLKSDGSFKHPEVMGGPQVQHRNSYTPCFSTTSGRSDIFFVKTPRDGISASPSRRLFGSSFLKQKPPNNDWRLPPNQRPGPSGAGARPEEGGPGAVVGTGPWPNPPTEAEQLQALMAAANGVGEATATLAPRYNAQYVPDYRQNVYIPGSTATLTANPQQQMPQQALPPPQAPPQVAPAADIPKAAPTPASKKKATKKDKK